MPSRRTAARLGAAATVAALLVPALPPAPAFAHNQLTTAVPADGARLDVPPREVVLTFVEPLDPRYTQIVVTGADRVPVPAAAPAVSGTSGRLALTGDLADGGYTVAYRVVSQDGHPVQGAVTFTVGDPPTARTLPLVRPATGPGKVPFVVAGAVALVALVAAGLWWRRPRAR